MRNSSECYIPVVVSREAINADCAPNETLTELSTQGSDRDRWRLSAESLQKQWHKNRCCGMQKITLMLQEVYLCRVAHPTVPTLSWVDERPHCTWCEQVPTTWTRCACCLWTSCGQRVRTAAAVGRLGSFDEYSQRCRGGHDARARHYDVLSIIRAVINEIQVSK